MVSMHDLSKTMPAVTSTQARNLQRSLVRESTEIVLPNSMTSERVEQEKAKGAIQKPARQVPPGYPRTPYMKPPPRVMREKTFMKAAKSPRDVVKARPLKKPSTLDSVEEYSESDDNAPVANMPARNDRGKIAVVQKPKEVPSKQVKTVTHQGSDKSKTVEVDTDGKVVKGKDIKTVGVKKPDPKNTDIRKGNAGQSGQKPVEAKVVDRKKGSAELVQKPVEVRTKQRVDPRDERQNGSGKPKNREGNEGEKPTTKDAAYNILQKLTGKKQAGGSGVPGGHRPGQVPSVNRPVRNNKSDTAERGKGEGSATGDEQQDLNKTIDLDKPVGIKPGDIRRGGSIRRVDKAAKENSEKRAKDLSGLYEQGAQKPASAPVRSSLRQSQDVGKGGWNYSTKASNPKQVAAKSQSADIRGREKQKHAAGSELSDGKTASAGPRQAIKVVVSEDGIKGSVKDDTSKTSQSKSKDSQLERRHVATSGSHGNREQGNKHSQKSAGSAKTYTKEAPQAVKSEKAADISASSAKTKGVKLQNAMISTSQEISSSTQVRESHGDADSLRASSAASSVHPKLQDSPYMKDNALFYPEKQRKRPGGGSAQGLGRSKNLE